MALPRIANERGEGVRNWLENMQIYEIGRFRWHFRVISVLIGVLWEALRKHHIVFFKKIIMKQTQRALCFLTGGPSLQCQLPLWMVRSALCQFPQHHEAVWGASLAETILFTYSFNKDLRSAPLCQALCRMTGTQRWMRPVLWSWRPQGLVRESMYVRFNGISATVREIQPSDAITQQKERCINTTE